MGLCTLPEGTFCQAITDDDCAQAEACTKHGACKAWAGICVSDLAGSDPLSPICDAVEVTGLTASASSEHKATPPYHFEASQLVDRDRRTSWQPDSKKGGVGEVITLKLPAPARLARLDVANGFQLRDMLGDLFAMNNRAARVLVRAGGVTVAATLPADGRGFAPISLPPVSTDKLTIEILTVEKGWRWNDLALTELRVYSCR
ncbi:MAG: hypothetical protein IT378_11450 [Sandaracinaceae bacterium]|nr:hypothetical protein [Sandaracinaceae bacterium]